MHSDIIPIDPKRSLRSTELGFAHEAVMVTTIVSLPTTIKLIPNSSHGRAQKV
jgi:hypothetical protein